MEQKELNEKITHPEHYTYGTIECIDYIQDKEFNFTLGNVIKYVTRAGHKSPETKLEDLYKAKQYLEFEISHLEKKTAVKVTKNA